MNFDQLQSPEQPTKEEWDDIFNVPPPTEEEIETRKNPDDIVDMSGENILGKREQALIDREDKDEAAIEETRRIIERISRKE